VLNKLSLLYRITFVQFSVERILHSALSLEKTHGLQSFLLHVNINVVSRDINKLAYSIADAIYHIFSITK
jgi:hypothetical protein